MIGFTSSAIVRDLPPDEITRRKLPRRWWGEFQKDLIVYSDIAGRLLIPSGFLTDGASVPRAVWSILSDTDPDILYPSYAHDLLYALRGQLPGRSFTREQCDQVIHELMLLSGCPSWKADLVYMALRAGGRKAWNEGVEDSKLKSAQNNL